MRAILYGNHPLTPSLLRRGTTLTPLLSEEGEGGVDNYLSMSKWDSTVGFAD